MFVYINICLFSYSYLVLFYRNHPRGFEDIGFVLEFAVIAGRYFEELEILIFNPIKNTLKKLRHFCRLDIRYQYCDLILTRGDV